jgi:hypothetical protein
VTISPASDLSRFVDLPSLQVAPTGRPSCSRGRAAFAYEPVPAVYPINRLTVLVAPLDLAMGLLLGGLAGRNLAVALLARRASRACRLRGALPALLTGVSCCGPLLAGARRAVHRGAARGQRLAAPPHPGRDRGLAAVERAAGPGAAMSRQL